MNRSQLAHLLRAACEITDDPDILVIGSQAILASHDEDELPAAATASIEADIAFLSDPDEEKADKVDGAIGELSPFHEQFGYYAQGVSVRLAVLPDGWQTRALRWSSSSAARANPLFLEQHDLVVSKLVTLREKDLAFAKALVEAGLVDVPTLRQRVQRLPADVDQRAVDRILSWLDHW
jgi:hypothetical protein